MSASYKLNILDTGDNYILATNTDSYDDAVKLYELMDITVNTIPTNLVITNDIAEFIYTSIGKIIAYGFLDGNNTNNIDILSKLIIDIQKTADYYKIKDFWYGVQNPGQRKYDNKLVFDPSVNNQSIDNVNSLSIDDLLPKNYIQRTIATEKTHIIYNTIYNITLVIDDITIKNVYNLEKNFPEFKLAKNVDNGLTTELKDNLFKLFHKVSFTSLSDVLNKIDAFYKLYDIPKDSEFKNDKTTQEKRRVKEFLNWNYILSNDIDKKMKANDLYKEVINFLCISMDNAAAFKKRLAGYLLEFSLQKKRYSDAYYYYGIEKKIVPTVSITDIEEKRASEKTEWFQNIPRINRLEPLDPRKDIADIVGLRTPFQG